MLVNKFSQLHPGNFAAPRVVVDFVLLRALLVPDLPSAIQQLVQAVFHGEVDLRHELDERLFFELRDQQLERLLELGVLLEPVDGPVPVDCPD